MPSENGAAVDPVAELAPFSHLPHYGDAVLVVRQAQRDNRPLKPVLQRIKAAFAEYKDGISYGQG